MAKATTTIKQVLNYQPAHAAWFAANQALFNQVVAFLRCFGGLPSMPLLVRLVLSIHTSPSGALAARRR